MESISKSRIQGIWDPAHSTRTGIIAYSTRVGIPSGCRHYIWLPPFSTRMYHIWNFCCVDIPPGWITSGILLPSTFHPGCPHSEFCCRRHSTRMFHIWNSDAGWERRAFQLPRSHIFGSAYSAHPESLAAILHSVAMFS